MAGNEYKIEIKNSILDNVHGFIGLSEVENQIERLPIFKRLQNISQLGLSHRIFPCAVHNRYIHSLGVMYIVDQMAVKLSMFNDTERQLLRLAGMLHDIGHYPLSHDIESVYKNFRKIPDDEENQESVFLDFKKTTLQSIDKLKNTNEVGDLRLNKISDRSFHHENVGTWVLKSSQQIKNILKQYYIDNNPFFEEIENPVDRVINEISAIITGNAQYKESLFGDKYSVMVQLMHSEIDADRIDYLLRDATFSGASYGTFDVGMLIQTLECGDYHGTKIVGVNLKGIGCAEQFLINRYLAYNQVINHKYTSIIGCIIQAIVNWLLSDSTLGYKYGNIRKIIQNHEKDANQDYLFFTDNALMSFINGLNETNEAYPEEIRILLRCLKRYQAFDLTSEVVVVDNDLDAISNSLKNTDIYSRLMECGEKNIAKIYQYREVVLTSHIPINEFEEKLDASQKTSEARELYLVDRLQDGAAVIEQGKEPYLLVDTERSVLRKLKGVRYSILREYNFDRFRQ